MKAHKELSIYSLISIFLLYAFILYFLTDSPPPPTQVCEARRGRWKTIEACYGSGLHVGGSDSKVLTLMLARVGL